jgi:hypothetical protein
MAQAYLLHKALPANAVLVGDYAFARMPILPLVGNGDCTRFFVPING